MKIFLPIRKNVFLRAVFLSFLALFLVVPTIGVCSGSPLYVAQKGNLQIYVFGTMHLGKSGDTLSPEVVAALKQSARLIFEIAPDEEALAEQQMSNALCRQPCLPQQISAEAMATIKRDYGPYLEVFGGAENMPVWMVAITMSMLDYLNAGYLYDTGSETLLSHVWGDRPVDGLETAEEQLRSLASLSLATQKASLEEYLSFPQVERIEFVNETFWRWRHSDADALYAWYLRRERELGSSEAVIQEFLDKIIVQRNRRFVDRLQPLLVSGKPVFLAVGALHLGGKDGVLNLLRRQGYTVTKKP